VPFGRLVKDSQYGLSISCSKDGNVPILGMKNINNGLINFQDLAYVKVSDTTAKKYTVNCGEILFNRTNSLDHVGKTGIIISDIFAVFASYLVRFRLKTTQSIPHFINYLFNTYNGRNYLRRLATPGVCQHNINQSELKKHFFIPLPPLPEQKRIAEILSTWDEVIEYTRKLIEAGKRREKGLMQQLFTGKKRLPGFDGEWKEFKLGELFSERVETNRQDLPLLAITGNRGVIPADEIERRDSSSADKSRYKRIAWGILVTIQ